MKLTSFFCSAILFGFLLGVHEGRIALWKDESRNLSRFSLTTHECFRQRTVARWRKGSALNPLRIWFVCLTIIYPNIFETVFFPLDFNADVQ